MIFLIVNIIIEDLFTVTTNTEGAVLWKKSAKILKTILEKYLKKVHFLLKPQAQGQSSGGVL